MRAADTKEDEDGHQVYRFDGILLQSQRISKSPKYEEPDYIVMSAVEKIGHSLPKACIGIVRLSGATGLVSQQVA